MHVKPAVEVMHQSIGKVALEGENKVKQSE
jgi:hypothetical protein